MMFPYLKKGILFNIGSLVSRMVGLRLNNFDVVICHDRSMERMLLKMDLTTRTCIGIVFDYLVDSKLVEQINIRPLHAPSRKVAFASPIGFLCFY